MSLNHSRLGTRFVAPILVMAGAFLLASCGLPVVGQYPQPVSAGSDIYDPTGNVANKPKNSVFGPNGLTFGGPSKPEPGAGSSGIGVNSFLWRASLDTIAFMPLASADPFGGIILTDWYSPPGSPDERFKAQIYILSRELRSDGVTAKVFKQVRQNGQWVSAPLSPDTTDKLIDAILTRARELRVASAAATSGS